MRCPRIYTASPLAAGTHAVLSEQAAHHVAKVLRMQPGESLTLFNGDGCDYFGNIATVDKRQVSIAIERAAAVERESPLAIHLGIAISKGERMDLVIQKATELGVSAITPLQSERVEVRLKGEREEKKLDHWRGVTIAACEQCGRAKLPDLHEITPLDTWLRGVDAERKFVLHHRSSEPLAATEAPRSVALLIGPEGGLSEAEIASAERAGFAPLRLGPRVLRTETAPLAALSVLQFVWGDLGLVD